MANTTDATIFNDRVPSTRGGTIQNKLIPHDIVLEPVMFVVINNRIGLTGLEKKTEWYDPLIEDNDELMEGID